MTTEILLRGLPLQTTTKPRLLILGSMPGSASLHATQYYAHPRNLFWDFMGELFSAGREHEYQQRLSLLHDHGIALWDVIHQCRRRGSLDSAIDNQSIIANDLPGLIRHQPSIQHLIFNGKKAEQTFKQHSAMPAGLVQLHTLPSTSPANAAQTRTAKLEAWRIVQRLTA